MEYKDNCHRAVEYKDNCRRAVEYKDNCQRAVEYKDNCHRTAEYKDNCHRAVEYKDNCHRTAEYKDNCHRAVGYKDNCRRAVEYKDNCHRTAEYNNCHRAVEYKDNCHRTAEYKDNCRRAVEYKGYELISQCSWRAHCLKRPEDTNLKPSEFAGRLMGTDILTHLFGSQVHRFWDDPFCIVKCKTDLMRRCWCSCQPRLIGCKPDLRQSRRFHIPGTSFTCAHLCGCHGQLGSTIIGIEFSAVVNATLWWRVLCCGDRYRGGPSKVGCWKCCVTCEAGQSGNAAYSPAQYTWWSTRMQNRHFGIGFITVIIANKRKHSSSKTYMMKFNIEQGNGLSIFIMQAAERHLKQWRLVPNNMLQWRLPFQGISYEWYSLDRPTRVDRRGQNLSLAFWSLLCTLLISFIFHLRLRWKFAVSWKTKLMYNKLYLVHLWASRSSFHKKSSWLKKKLQKFVCHLRRCLGLMEIV